MFKKKWGKILFLSGFLPITLLITACSHVGVKAVCDAGEGCGVHGNVHTEHVSCTGDHGCEVRTKHLDVNNIGK
jgi:hypothetical protein